MTNNTAGHTAGPWPQPKLTIGCDAYFIADGGNWDICEIKIANSRSPDVARANASLIAAAPDLLAGLSNALELLQGAASGDSEFIEKRNARIAAIEAAISKATGAA